MPTPHARQQRVVRDRDGVARHKSVLRTVTQAITDLSRHYPYRTLSRRLVADRAGLAYLDVCGHFASIDALIAETCLYRLRESPLVIEFHEAPRERIGAQFRQLIMLLACEPRYGTACVRALMSKSESVQPIRKAIDVEVHRRVSAALGSGAWPEVVATMHLALLGAVTQAAAGNTTLDVIGDQLDRLVDVLLPTNDGLSFSSAVARDC